MLDPDYMEDGGGRRVLEWNARFGDPETEVYIPRLESDLAELLLAVVEGRLKNIEVKWSSDACVCVVLATREYPLPSVRGHAITGISDANKIPGVTVFHGSTFFPGIGTSSRGYCAGEGRILAVTGKGPTLADARATAYAGVDCIKFEGMQFRRKIALME
jgi:phosphoribosylamine--glycine ligase